MQAVRSLRSPDRPDGRPLLQALGCLIVDREALRRLAMAWSIAQDSEDNSPTYAENEWAVDFFYELPFVNPEAAWEAIQLVIEARPNDEVILMTGVGPLESLLGQDGESFIERVEDQARHSPVFRQMMRHVWLPEDSPICERFQQAADAGLIN